MDIRRLVIIVLLILFSAWSLSAQEEAPSVADTLFHHILNGDSLDIFPFLDPLPLPLGITAHLFMLFLSALLVIALFVLAKRRPGLRPRGIRMAMEILVLFVRDDIVYPVMGEKRGEKWLPFFATLFIYLLTMNLLGLIPAFKTATGNITVTTAMAVMILVLIFAVGFKQLGFFRFFKNMYPEGTPLPIGIFVTLLELLGTFIKSMVLSLRLFANMFAGHLAILSFLVLMLVLTPLFAVVSLPFAVFTYTLEVLVAVIQALVFTLLSCIFISLASTAHEE